jgi:SsrA-binding protein
LSKVEEDDHKVVCRNRKARHDYHVEETFEAGIALAGSEVKSLREGRAQISEAYAHFIRGELFLTNAHISLYEQAHRDNHPVERDRKLLLNRSELRRIAGRVQEKGLTLIPLEIYFKRSWAKVSLALARGKKEYDRRHDIAERDEKRAIDRVMKRHRRGGNFG